MRVLARALLIALAIPAFAQVPNRIGYQGRLLNTDGSPVTGVVPISFYLYDLATGGTALGCDLLQVALSDGYYAVLLGDAGGCQANPPAISVSNFDGRDLWLELFLAGAALAPRQRIASAPYALRSATAVNLRGGTAEASAVTVGGATGVSITSGGITLGGTIVVDASGKATVATGAGLTGDGTATKPVAVATDGVTNILLANDAASLSKVSAGTLAVAGGNVGIGTATPGEKLHVMGTTRIGHSTNTAYYVDQTYLGATYNFGSSEATDNVIFNIAGGGTWTTGGGYSFQRAGVTSLRIDTGGSVGIGVATPLARLSVAGAVQLADDTGACTTARAGTIRFQGGQFQGCDGSAWTSLSVRPDGSSQSSAAVSCKALQAVYPTAPDGSYWIDPDGGATTNAFKAYCLMSRAGGGWTKALQFDNATNLGAIAAVNVNGTWTQGTSGAGKLSAAEVALLWSRRVFLMRTASPSDGTFLANGAGYLVWTATGGTMWTEWGTSYRPASYRLDCERTGDDIVDEVRDYPGPTSTPCPHGTYWLYDHTAKVGSTGCCDICYGFTQSVFTSNLHFCGNGAAQSGGNITGITQIYIRD